MGLKREKKEKDRNRGTRTILITIICGYLFFLTSGLWLPDFREVVEATPYYEKQALEKHNVYLTRWVYAPAENVMEIVLEVETSDLLASGLDYEALERTKGELAASIVQKEADYMIFRITGIPENWKEISLRLSEPGSENLLKLYTNSSAVEEVESLPEKDAAGYTADRLNGQIGYDTYRIGQKRQAISELSEENRQLEARIEELENSTYPTQEEADNALSVVEAAEDRIRSNQKSIDEKESEIGELRERTKSIREQMEGGDDN